MRPSLLITAEKQKDLRSIHDVRADITTDSGKMIWKRLQGEADADLELPPFTPSTLVANRSPGQARAENRDYEIVAATAMRIQRSALVNLITGDTRYRDDALGQLECLYDEKSWPDWRDLSHSFSPADLRTGQFMRAIGLAYDWLYPSLSEYQRRWLVEGLDRRGIQPYLQSFVEKPFWIIDNEPNNWMTCIVGGAGIAGMALGDDHSQSETLIETAVERMKRYMNVLGSEGEFNESVGYAGAMRFPIEFFNIHRYWRGGGENLLLDGRFRLFCDWYIHMTVPPGHPAPFGDTHVEADPFISMFATMAKALQNPVYQWFYECYANRRTRSDSCEELLSFDPHLKAIPPDGILPLGRGYRQQGACWSNRTDWHPVAARCVVYGKGGHGSEIHGNHDAGTICIDGYGKRLITDPGSLHYPADFFGENRYEYYNASVSGHNVPVVGGRETKVGKEHAARILDMVFLEKAGCSWVVDTSDLYKGIELARRGVIHLSPGVVAVIDRLICTDSEQASFRWHTFDRTEISGNGEFSVVNGDVSLQGRMVVLNGDFDEFSRGEHEYRPPYNSDRLGNLLDQKHESYVELLATGEHFLVLSLFSVFEQDNPVSTWINDNGTWRIDAEDGAVAVTRVPNSLKVAGHGTEISLNLEICDSTTDF